MFIYLGICIGLFSLTLLDFNNKVDFYIHRSPSIKGIYFLASILLVMFLVLRYNTGYDYDAYIHFYKVLAQEKNIFAGRFEPGFIFSIYLFRDILKLSAYSFLFFMGILAVVPKVKFLYKYSLYPVFSLMLYFPAIFLGQDFGQFRQGIAVSFCFLAIPCILEKNAIKFLFLNLIAISFHYSAIVFLPFYFISRIEITNKRFYLYLIISFFISFISLGNIVAVIINTLFGKLIGVYVISSITGVENSSIILFSLNYLIRLFVLIFIFYNRKKIFSIHKIYKHLFNLYFWGTVLYALFYSMPFLTGRLFNYFKYLDIILLPLILLTIQSKEMKFFYISFMFIYCIYRVYNIVNGQPESFIPYDYLFNWRRI